MPYFLSFALTHAVNFLLGLRKVLSISGVRLNFSAALLMMACAVFAVFGGTFFTGIIRRAAAFLGLFFGMSFYLGTLGKGDLRWLRGLIFHHRKQPKSADATNS